MMYKKRMMAAFLGATMLCAAGAPAFAADSTVDSSPAAEDVLRASERELVIAKIIDIVKDDKGAVEFVTVNREGQEYGDIMLRISPETIVLDSKTGTPVGIDALKVGEVVYAYHSPAMTKSLPPQTNAEAIVINVSEDAPGAMLHTVQSVEKTEQGTRLLVDQGSLYITVVKDAAVSPLYTKNIVTAEDIQAGDRVFAWYNVVLTSYPGQTSTDKIVLIPADQEQPAAAKEVKNQIAVIGTEAAGTVVLQEASIVKDGAVMVPLRAVADALQYDTDWVHADKTAALKGSRDAAITVRAGLAGTFLSEDARLWVSTKIFEEAGATVTVDQDTNAVRIAR